MENELTGVASDGTQFTAESPEVIAYREANPDVKLDMALAAVIKEYESSLNASEANEVVEQSEDVPTEAE